MRPTPLLACLHACLYAFLVIRTDDGSAGTQVTLAQPVRQRTGEDMGLKYWLARLLACMLARLLANFLACVLACLPACLID